MASKAPGRTTYVVADARDRAVFPHLDAVFTKVAYKVDTITIGDYLICADDKKGGPDLLACFERKTWTDFAKSFGDGRYRNMDKMLRLRSAAASFSTSLRGRRSPQTAERSAECPPAASRPHCGHCA